MWDLTTSIFALPLSLTLNANDSSKPVEASCNVRKAWCGLFPVPPSVVVRTILRVSAASSAIAFEINGEVGESLYRSRQLRARRLVVKPYFSFAPPPTPAPLLWIVSVASSNDQLAARLEVAKPSRAMRL